MKTKFLMLVMCLFTLSLSAQEPLRWSVNAGLGISNITGKDATGTEGKLSWMVGVGLEKPMTDIWSLYSGLNIQQKGAKASEQGYELSCNMMYLELPVMVGARIITNNGFDLVFKAGPYLAYGVGGKTKVTEGNVEVSIDTFGDNGAGMNRFDTGLKGAILFEMDKIALGVEASRGLVKMMDGNKVYHMNVLLSTGYRF